MKFEAEAEVRKEVGKGPAREIRRNGKIPAVFYGQGKSIPLVMDPRAVRKIIIAQSGGSGLVSLKLINDGATEDRVAVIQDYQVDPITGLVLHVDLFEVSMDKAVRVKVLVQTTGETPIGVKRDKGVLHQNLRELHIECLPGVIPEHIDVDVSELTLGQGIHVKDVQAGPSIKVLDDGDLMVVSVSAPISDAKLAASMATDATSTHSSDSEAAGSTKGKPEPSAGASKAGEGKK